jgi:DNA polymerase-3 subunit epsilon
MDESFTAVDFETATTNRMACQVGIVVVENGEIVEEVSYLIQPPSNKYDRQTMKVHHLTPDDTEDAPTFDEVWDEIEPYFLDTTIVAHNAPFDRDVLMKNLRYYDIPTADIGEFVCTSKLHRGRSLEDLCIAFDMPYERHHDALFDAECCAAFYLKYLNGEEPDYSLIEKETTPTKRNIKKLGGDALVELLSKVSVNPDNPFYNRKVVITGVFAQERSHLEQVLKKMGATLSVVISKSIDCVLIGDKPGPSKMVKLEKLLLDGCNIQRLYQADLYAILSKYIKDNLASFEK